VARKQSTSAVAEPPAVEGVGGANGGVLLETKLTAPGRRTEHIPRRGLLDLVRAGGPRKLTVVTAPPGFGKTVLLAEWAATSGNGPRVAWLSLDENDNDPVRFFTYLAAAVQRVEATFSSRAVSVLRSPGGGVDVALPLLVNDLAGLDPGVVLVLEDYHAISSDEIHEPLGYLIERAPPAFSVVVSARADPPLPLARLRARGELAEVRADQLRFTEQETSVFLTDGLGLDLTADDLARLQARTEGWPAALYLAALSLRGRPDTSAVIDDFAGDDRYLVDYLTSEVLARQPQQLRSFLLQTSILKRFCGPLCDAVLDRHGSAALLTDLEHANLLLVPLDGRRRWYRYHHLFGELLQAELIGSDPDAVPRLHRRASAWYRDAGLIVDAAEHASASGDLAAAVQLVAGNYAFFVGEGQLATVLHWLAALPEPVAAQDWLVCFAGGVVSAHAGLLDEAEHWLELAQHAPQLEHGDQEPAVALAALAGYLRLLRGDIAGTVAYGRQALAGGGDAFAALGAQMVLAPGLWWADQAAEANAVLERAARTAQAAGVPATTVYALGIRSAIALDNQDERAAGALAVEAIELMHAAGLDEHPWAAMAHIVHGTLLGRRGELEAAAEEIERGLAFGERLDAWQLIAYAALALADVRQRQHNPAAARRLLARVRGLLESLPDPGDGLDRLERTEKALRLRRDTARSTTVAPYWELSRRELDVLRLLPSMMTQREIAAELYVSFNTVRTHTRVIFQKLGVASRPEAVDRARELGLLER
jgi:LuxR family maltose regulon positive regulatory protein